MPYFARIANKLICLGGLAFAISACSSPATAESPLTNVMDSTISFGNDSYSLEYEVIPERTPTPLDEYLMLIPSFGSGWEFLDPESQRRVFETDAVRYENWVAECMHRFGFDYIPILEQYRYFPPGSNEEWRPREREWVAQWGYAHVSRPDGVISDDRLPTMYVAIPSILGRNEAAVAEMSESERQAWDDALWAFSLADELGYFSDYGLEIVGGDGRISNCRSWAGVQQRLEIEAISNNDEFRPLSQAITQLRDEIRETDISPADIVWSDCMDNRGFPGFTRQWEASAQILQELNDLQTQISQNWAPGRPTMEDSPAVAELQEREINTALADFDCRISTGFAAAQQAHVLQRETQFVQDNRIALNALRDAVEQNRLPN